MSNGEEALLAIGVGLVLIGLAARWAINLVRKTTRDWDGKL